MYTIYHIEGVKIGCTKLNPKSRVKQQGYSAFQVLEVHDDIQVASKREIELQIEYGYGRDTSNSYYRTANLATPESRSKGGAIGGKISGKITGPINGKINGKKSQSIEYKCPWCFRTIKGPNYFQWHGDRCKFAW